MFPIESYVTLGLTLDEAHFYRKLGRDPETAKKYKAWSSSRWPGLPEPGAPTRPGAFVEKTVGSLSVEDRQVMKATGIGATEYVKRYNDVMKADAALAAGLTPHMAVRAPGAVVSVGSPIELPTWDCLSVDERAVCKATGVAPAEYLRRKALEGATKAVRP
ncbi:MAG TPA: hypothetical protein VF316_16595 [Polyangiaceae bacterium]